MLDKKRIKEAETNVRSYLTHDLLKKESNETAQAMFLDNCDLSLRTAQKLIEDELQPHLWVIVISYYAMYYIANAVLLAYGNRVGSKISHKVTEDALIVFIRPKLKKQLIEEYEEVKEDALDLIAQRTDEMLKNFEYERGKRSKFQYRMSDKIKESAAHTSFERAKTFVTEMKKLL